MEKLDFVLPRGDGSDEARITLKKQYKEGENVKLSLDSEANADYPSRDSGLLKYWFRGVEYFALWGNRFFLLATS